MHGLPKGEVEVRPKNGGGSAMFQDPPGVAGSGWPSGGRDPAFGVVVTKGTVENGAVARSTCTLPVSEHGICAASLDDVISRYG